MAIYVCGLLVNALNSQLKVWGSNSMLGKLAKRKEMRLINRALQKKPFFFLERPLFRTVLE